MAPTLYFDNSWKNSESVSHNTLYPSNPFRCIPSQRGFGSPRRGSGWKMKAQKNSFFLAIGVNLFAMYELGAIGLMTFVRDAGHPGWLSDLFQKITTKLCCLVRIVYLSRHILNQLLDVEIGCRPTHTIQMLFPYQCCRRSQYVD